MTVVAIAGASSGVGKTLVEVIKQYTDHQILVLTRKGKSQSNGQVTASSQATVVDDEHVMIEVDYSDVDAHARLLEVNKVDIFISAISASLDASTEINMIRAADQARTVKRYIPSIWGSYRYGPEQAKWLPLVNTKLDTMLELEKSTSLEYCAIYCGYFLDYYGMPHVKSNLVQGSIVIDMENNAAAIPGSGDVPVVFTYSYDMARFVIASLDLPKWPKEYWVVGDRITWNEFLALAEDIKGVKFDVSHDSRTDLENGKVTILPCQKWTAGLYGEDLTTRLYSGFSLWSDQGILNTRIDDETLNERFPEIKAFTVKKLLESSWKTK